MTAATATLGGTRRSALREFGAAVATIMVKELRSRMRGRRAFVVLTVYLGILALITYGVYVVVGPQAQDQAAFTGGFVGGMPNASALIGQSIFIVLSFFQLILVCFIAPAFTSGQISLEREKQTLDLLISTPMRPGAIVVGKLAAALAFVVLMIVAAIPISAIVLMYGGASVDDIVRQQLVLLATALVLGSIGLFYSALLKRTQAATVLTYCTVLALTLGTLMIFVFWSAVVGRDDSGFGIQRRAPEQLMWVNPGVAMIDVVANVESDLGQALNGLRGAPFDMSISGGEVRCDELGSCVAVDGNGQVAEGDVGVSGYWWPRVALSFIAISIVLTLVSTRLVVPAGMRFVFRRRPRRNADDAPPAMLVAASGTDGSPVIEELGERER